MTPERTRSLLMSVITPKPLKSELSARWTMEAILSSPFALAEAPLIITHAVCDALLRWRCVAASARGCSATLRTDGSVIISTAPSLAPPWKLNRLSPASKPSSSSTPSSSGYVTFRRHHFFFFLIKSGTLLKTIAVRILIHRSVCACVFVVRDEGVDSGSIIDGITPLFRSI